MSSQKTALSLALLVLLTLGATVAEAKSKKVLTYRFGTIWSTTVRMLRVDLGYQLTDKDKDNGYILFVFPGTGSVKRCPASLEIVEFVDERGYQHRRLQLAIAHQPRYVEVHLLDKLERKLLEEHGRPPEAKRAKPKKPKKDPPSSDQPKK